MVTRGTAYLFRGDIRLKCHLSRFYIIVGLLYQQFAFRYLLGHMRICDDTLNLNLCMMTDCIIKRLYLAD